MKSFFERIDSYGLFVKIFLVMFFSIIAITITITISTLKMSENLFTETFSITNSKILAQIQESVEEFNYSVVNTVNNIEQSGKVKTYLTESDTNSLEMSKSFYNMSTQMNLIGAHLDNYNTGITVLGINGRDFSTNRIYWPNTENELANHEITLNSLDNPKRLSYHYDDLHTDELKKPAIIASRALSDRKSGEVYGVLYIAMQELDFRQFYTSYTSGGNNVAIINGAGTIVSSNNTELIGREEQELLKHAKDIEKLKLNYKNVEFLDKEQIVLAEYLPPLDLYLVNFIDKKLVMANIIDKKSIVLISILIAGIALLFVYFISRRLTSSLTSLVNQINSIAKSDFDHYVTVSGSYETKQVATAFNFMLDELHEYVEELILTQKNQRNAELAALQQQINPHFLYNTLASIKIMVKQGNKEKASEMINKLISLLQNTIGNISETNTVEQELSNMKDYTFINQARYGEQIRVNYYITPDVLSYELPKLIIQPFIENAFFHAFNKKTTGFIHVMIGQEENNLICEIIDNGDGMETNLDKQMPSYKSKRQLFSGIGVKNVSERIKLLYGERYGVEISSELGEGTKVKLRLPIIKSVQNPKL
ncbi:sensor histidine kinase [Sporosarcina sp. Marseille-Q4063]|uniref:cache domain-containing sensor histidine kinase n=1 Tax=Sporosarcina sp. Marseille-Q4063 TaxID=2810514 RepID=UPI001BAFFF8E|nr:histidine kinase [Sporosarcina sp. Marseille-Q4063]QUW21486.1 sensor histidine kinase [Sporosarcina sp. Marseille-Q4063]